MFIRPNTRPLQAVAGLALAFAGGIPAHAEVTFDWATVNNAGNAPHASRYGSVAYDFRIATTEVTNRQYAEFLNAVDPTGANRLELYRSGMASNHGGIEYRRENANGSKFVVRPGRENNPVTYVSWYAAIRFTNWLHNGQGAGDTETGAYTLRGGSVKPSNVASITRQAGARYFLPSTDEWFKAAYHDAAAGTAGKYFTYATGSNDDPVSNQPDDDAAAVNFHHFDGRPNGFNDGYAVSGQPNYPKDSNPLTDVGAYTEARSPYGTYDQNGNVAEWNETKVGTIARETAFGVMGGSWVSQNPKALRSFTLGHTGGGSIGFRVASPAP